MQTHSTEKQIPADKKQDLDNTPEYLRPARNAVNIHGTSFESLLYFNQDAQKKRFQTLTASVDFNHRKIADLGCGRGDLLDWNRRMNINYSAYIGVDGIEEYIDHCNNNTQQQSIPDANFMLADFVAEKDIFKQLVDEHKVDTLVFSGSLNTLSEQTAKDVLQRAWNSIKHHSGYVLAFNFLSQIEGEKANNIVTDLTRLGTMSMIEWALRETPLTFFCQYYLAGHDATIVMIATGDKKNP